MWFKYFHLFKIFPFIGELCLAYFIADLLLEIIDYVVLLHIVVFVRLPVYKK